jgi:hypothetical protein
MKKLLLFLGVSALFITTSCEKDPVYEAIAPKGDWAELIPVPVGPASIKQMSWDSMQTAFTTEELAELVFSVRQITFTSNSSGDGGIMRITVHIGDGPSGSDECRRRTEYIEITYKYELVEKGIGRLNIESGKYTGPGFVGEPDVCSNNVHTDLKGYFRFSYENKERTRMRLNHFIPSENPEDDHTPFTIHILEFRNSK